MGAQYLKIIFLTSAAIFLASAAAAWAASTGEKPGLVDDALSWPDSRAELTKERVDRVMSRLKVIDPNKATKLEKLRGTSPEAFRTELRELIHERFRELAKSGGKEGIPGQGPREILKERLHQRCDDYLTWLKANAPEEAERLTDLQKSKPDLYKRQLLLGARKYGRIAEAAQENPELANILREDFELRNKSFELLRKIKATTNEAEKRKLTAELEDVVSDRFDVILQRKQMEYDRLRQEIERLQEEVKEGEIQLEKWKANKPDRIKERVNELLTRTEKFEWE